jgi:hypothetical protein
MERAPYLKLIGETVMVLLASNTICPRGYRSLLCDLEEEVGVKLIFTILRISTPLKIDPEVSRFAC